jgi:hypothetical protein
MFSTPVLFLQAGLATKTHPEQLLIALEPEVAGIYCASQDFSKFVVLTPLKTKEEAKERKQKGVFVQGMKYIVMDCGGNL